MLMSLLWTQQGLKRVCLDMCEREKCGQVVKWITSHPGEYFIHTDAGLECGGGGGAAVCFGSVRVAPFSPSIISGPKGDLTRLDAQNGPTHFC